MAATKSTELSATEIELKRRGRRRLIGAATIGLLGVVFLPMIFDGEPKRSSSGSPVKKQEISIQVPAKDSLPVLPAPSAVPPAPVPQVKVAVEPAKEVASEVATVATGAAPLKSVPTVAASKPEKPAVVAKAQPTTPEKQGFVVQLGVFGDADNANLAIAKMKEAKLPVYTDSIPIKTGAATRVRVGPFPTREKADSALARIKLAGSDGKIVPLP